MSDIPQRISQFELQARLYSGDRCDVFEASFEKSDGELGSAAVKVLRAKLACVGEELRSFLQEISWARKVQHPMFPRVIEAGESEGSYFLAMDLVDGWTLDELLDTAYNNGTTLSPEVGLMIAHRLAVGTHELHEWFDENSMSGSEELGLVHQGIDPSNIMIRRTGSVSLLDFGTIRSGPANDEFPSEILELEGEYHAPERLNGFGGTPQSDVYSLGRVLERMIAQMEPGSLSGDGDTLIDRACHPSPNARFASMADFARAIEDVSEHRGLSLSKKVCATFSALVFDAEVQSSSPRENASPQDAYYHVDSEGLETVMHVQEETPEAGRDDEEAPILLDTGRAITDVDDLESGSISSSAGPAAGDSAPLDDWGGVMDDDDLEEEEVTDVSDIIEANVSPAEHSNAAHQPPVEALHVVSRNVVSQPDSRIYSDDEHQEPTAFMPAEAMAAMASKGEEEPKRPAKKAFPQELIPTRTYEDSDSVIRELKKIEGDSDK